MTTQEQIGKLHQAYCEATGFDLALNAHSERLWFNALAWSITPDDVRLVVKGRIKRNQTLQYKLSLHLNKLIGDESDLAQFTNELAEIRAHMRKPVFNPGKKEALEATGRSGEPEPPKVKHINEIFNQMREKTA